MPSRQNYMASVLRVLIHRVVSTILGHLTFICDSELSSPPHVMHGASNNGDSESKLHVCNAWPDESVLKTCGVKDSS